MSCLRLNRFASLNIVLLHENSYNYSRIRIATHLSLRSSRDFKINGRAVTLDTVKRLSLSSSSISLLRLVEVLSSTNIDLVDVRLGCCVSIANETGRRGDSPICSIVLFVLILLAMLPVPSPISETMSANGTGGAE